MSACLSVDGALAADLQICALCYRHILCVLANLEPSERKGGFKEVFLKHHGGLEVLLQNTITSQNLFPAF